ncbi:hypothetical protein BHF71_08775 [Vulcanibacillus modesticaldus]|uniref:Flagellar biosynthesis protein FlgN n=2 Tax=Vulcanibacillus modesticaldus TaxID=337097 RepID=A0A1D2YUW2_9BACI|nr:hypothetical protein BHF71_08775 [Vulcanibacillus modesticaldus]
MMASFPRLIEVLMQIYQLQLEMLDLAKQKKQVLIDGSIEELSKIIHYESLWIKKVSKLEDERMKVVQQILNDNDIKADQITINDLINNLDSPDDKKRLEDIHGKLTKTIEEIQQLNDLNTQLIEQSLKYISHTINLITEDPSQGYTYSKPMTKTSTVAKSGLFDKKA